MLTHVMLDIETWGVSPYSTIISVGACQFDPYTLEMDKVIMQSFEVAVDPVSCQGMLRFDAKTVMWWLSDERNAARTAWLGKPKVDLLVVLDSFADWLQSLGRRNNLRIWGNGSDFDNTLLAQAYEITKRDVPWSYRQNRCYRTLRNLVTIDDAVFMGTTHTALADAENQALHANQIVTHLGIKLT